MSDSRACSFEGCDSAGRLRLGLCRTHYEQQRKGLPLTPIRWRWGAKSGAACSFDGCDKAVQSLGLCGGHYRQRRQGVTLTPLRVMSPRRQGCGFAECTRPYSTAGLCAGHYAQQTAGRSLTPLREYRDPQTRDDLGNKQCRRCDMWLAEDAFKRNQRSSDRLYAYCARCVRDEYLRSQYGIGVRQYEAMLTAQGGVCAVCKTSDPAGRELAVDHDHSCCPDPAKSCGECVRGLLCWPCNVGVGHLRDDPEILTAAAAYLAA